jgi:DNA-binding transcriptional LysR family regulator
MFRRWNVDRLLDLNEIAIFSCVAEEGSLTGASKRLGLPKSTVSRKLSALEERLRTRLLHRSPQRVDLTEAGRVLYAEARSALVQMGEAAERVRDYGESLLGKVRVAAPTDFGVAVLGPHLLAFARRYPQVSLELDLSDKKVDLTRKGFDFAVRIGAVGEPSLVARRVGSINGYLVASPDYAKCHGLPRTIEELSHHRYLEFILATHVEGALRLHGPSGAIVEAHFLPAMRVNSLPMLRDAVLAGLGVARLSSYFADALIADGRLVRVLPDHVMGDRPVFLVHLGRRLLPARVSLLMDYLARELCAPR